MECNTIDQVTRELDLRIRSRVPITFVQTHEEDRFLQLLIGVRGLKHGKHVKKDIYVWTRTEGLRRINVMDGGFIAEEPPFEDTMDPQGVLLAIRNITPSQAFVVMNDFGPYLSSYQQDNEILVRMIKDLAKFLKGTLINVFMVGPDFPTITTLEKEVKPLVLALPSREEMAGIVDARIADLGDSSVRVVLPPEARVQLADAMAGLTEDEAATALATATVTNGCLDENAIPVILEQKKDAIRRSGALEFVPPRKLATWGGYGQLIASFKAAAETFKPEARAFGLKPHKGVFLIGPPGVGKTVLMQIVSDILNRALLRMSIGAVMGEGGGIIGQPEMSMTRALQIADALECVLGIDEYEKTGGGIESSGKTDSGTTARTLGIFLTWQAEQTHTFVVATANNPRMLRPEQMRAGRFTLVWVPLPSPEDRAAIFATHLQMRQRDPGDFDLDELAEKTDRFSGAEIEQAVENALLEAWMENHGAKDIQQRNLLSGIEDVMPSGIVNAADLADMEEWAKDKLGAVSAADTAKQMLLRQKATVLSTKQPLEV